MANGTQVPEKIKSMSTTELREKMAKREEKEKKDKVAQKATAQRMGEGFARGGTNFLVSLGNAVLQAKVPATKSFGGLPIGTDAVFALAGAAGSAFMDPGYGAAAMNGVGQAGIAGVGRQAGEAIAAKF